MRRLSSTLKRRSSKSKLREGFRCSKCGKWHEGLPLDYAFDAPFYWEGVSKAADKEKSYLGPDFCVIKNEDFFVRGLIEIPILDMKASFRWGAWVSLSRKNFDRMVELWHDPRLLKEPAYFGWLSSKVSGYPNTLNLRTQVRSRKVHQRPYIQLESTDHPLAVEQREGITMARVREIAQLMLHPKK